MSGGSSKDSLAAALARARAGLDGGRVARLSALLHQELPKLPYWPGRTPRPGEGIVFELSAAAKLSVSKDNWRDSDAFAAGFLLVERGCFWEAHEVWEPVWQALPLNSAERQFLQAMIQFANARLKAVMGQERAAARLVEIATAHLKEATLRGWPGAEV